MEEGVKSWLDEERLREMGIVLEDTREGVKWKRA